MNAHFSKTCLSNRNMWIVILLLCLVQRRTHPHTNTRKPRHSYKLQILPECLQQHAKYRANTSSKHTPKPLVSVSVSKYFDINNNTDVERTSQCFCFYTLHFTLYTTWNVVTRYYFLDVYNIGIDECIYGVGYRVYLQCYSGI